MKFLLLLLSAAVAISAQTPRAQGHAFFGLDNPPHGNFGNGSVGAGADIFVYKGAAFSPSLGYLFEYGGGVAVVTVNGSYHFLRGKGKFQPFATAGYGDLANLSGGISLFNFHSNSYRELTSIRFCLSFR